METAISDVLLVISLLGVLQGLVLCAMVLLRTDINKLANRVLAVLVCLSSIVMLLVTLVNSGLVEERVWMGISEWAIALTAGPLLLIFVQLQDPESRFRPRMFLMHLAPAAAFTLVASFALISRRELHVSVVPFVLHIQVYVVWAWIRYRSILGQVRGHPSPQLSLWTPLLFFFFVSMGVAQWLRIAFTDVELMKLIVPCISAVSFYVLTLTGFFYSRIFSSQRHRSRPTPVANGQFASHRVKLQELMVQDQVFLDRKLTIGKMAVLLDVQPAQVSALIRASYDQSFSDFVNGHRIAYARAMLVDPAYAHLKIEAIGWESGFRSRSAFYRSFVHFTDVSPAQFRRQAARFAN